MPEETWLNDSVFVVDDFLTPEECQHYIRLSEDVGYEEALVNTPQGQVRRANVRNNERVLFKDDELAAMLWERAEDFVPAEWNERTPIGVNELFRFYRYDPGQQFQLAPGLSLRTRRRRIQPADVHDLPERQL